MRGRRGTRSRQILALVRRNEHRRQLCKQVGGHSYWHSVVDCVHFGIHVVQYVQICCNYFMSVTPQLKYMHRSINSNVALMAIFCG